MLGYAPQADVMFLHPATGRRVWVELEISRADPVANHAKFATAHLIHPFKPTDTFLSMVSRHVDRGRRNLAAHTVGVLRALGLRAFQTILLPGCDGTEISRLNHLDSTRIREEAPESSPELRRLFGVANRLATIADSDIHLAANEVEVLYNLHRWNAEMTDRPAREAWGCRTIRYFVSDADFRNFAPSKFAAYVRLFDAASPARSKHRSLTGMGIAAYLRIPHDQPIFDGNRAWTHLRDNLRFEPVALADLEAVRADRFWRWADAQEEVLHVSSKGAMVLVPPAL